MAPFYIPDTIPALLLLRAGSSPGGIAGWQRTAGRWQATTWAELLDDVRRAATGLKKRGLGKGDRLAILAHTCREWQVAELAALRIGAVVVGLDPQQTPEQIAGQMRHAQVCGLVVDGPANLAKVPCDVRRRLEVLVVLDDPAPLEGIAWAALWAGDESLFADAGPSADDPAALCFTSGTTGAPRSIIYTHRQLLAGIRALRQAFPLIGAGDSLVCWLPLAHLYQRMMNLVAVAAGIPVCFVDDARQVLDCLQEMSPTLFVAVPRFYEKLYQSIHERLARLTGWRRWLAEAALMTGAEMARHVRTGEAPSWGLRLRHAVLDLLVLRRLRRVLGGRMRLLLTGSAPVAPWLLEFFHSVGLLVLEAYGVAENTIPLTVNQATSFRFGSVGRPLPGNDLSIAADGEVLVRGPGLFRGYEGEASTTGLFRVDGFYHTGDIGRFDEDGYLHLLGRKKEVIKLSTGRRLAPARIEAVYRQSPHVDQVVVLGDGRAHLVALVTPKNTLAASAHNLIQQDFDTLANQVAPCERIRAFALVPQPFSVGTGELTPSLKLRRQAIATRYRTTIEHLYEVSTAASSGQRELVAQEVSR